MVTIGSSVLLRFGGAFLPLNYVVSRIHREVNMEVLNYVSPMGETEAAREALFQVVYDAAHFRALHSPYPFNQAHAEDVAQEVVAQFAAADEVHDREPRCLGQPSGRTRRRAHVGEAEARRS